MNYQDNRQRYGGHSGGSSYHDDSAERISALSRKISEALGNYEREEVDKFETTSESITEICKGQGGRNKWHEYLTMVRRLKIFIEQPQNKETWQKETYRLAIKLKYITYITSKDKKILFPAAAATAIIEKVLQPNDTKKAVNLLSGLELIISAVLVEAKKG